MPLKARIFAALSIAIGAASMAAAPISIFCAGSPIG